jgi:hypothetical protein
VASPSNPLSDAIRSTQELAGFSYMTPGAGAGLSPKLLDILQHREPNKPELGDTTPTNSLHEKPAIAVVDQTQYPADGTTQKSGGADQGQNGHPFTLPFRSGTLNTVRSDSPGPSPSEPWPMIQITSYQQTPDQVPEPSDTAQNPPESPLVIPEIEIHPLNSFSDPLSPGIAGGGDLGAGKPGSQVFTSYGQKFDGLHRGNSTVSPEKPRLGIVSPGLGVMGRTPSRSSSIRKGGSAAP